MSRFRLTPREWALFLFPCGILLISHMDKFRDMDGSHLALSLNPFARARENARRSSCQSNLKQIGLGIAQYRQDYDDHFPLNTFPKKGWVYLVNPYTKSCPILFCPSDSFARTTPMIPSYWMNGNLNEKTGSKSGVSIKRLDRPDHTFLMGDGDASKAAGNYTLTEKSWQSKAKYSNRHLFGANYLFTDGHVKALDSEVVNSSRKLDPCCTNQTFKLEVIKVGGPKTHDDSHNHDDHEHSNGHEH